MNNFTQAILSISFIIVASSISYYFIIFLPQQNTKTQNDIEAIRSVIAPNQQITQQKTKSYKEQAEEWDAYFAEENVKTEAYLECKKEYEIKVRAFVQEFAEKKCADKEKDLKSLCMFNVGPSFYLKDEPGYPVNNCFD